MFDQRQQVIIEPCEARTVTRVAALACTGNLYLARFFMSMWEAAR